MAADLADDLLILLVDVTRHFRTYGDQVAQSLGVTRAQLSILARLDGNPDLTQKELAAIAEVSPMTVGRLIDCLERHGLVERCSDASDRRIWRLRLTPKAAPLLREIKRIRAKLHSVTTKDIEPAVLKAMTLGLRQMKQNVVSRRLTEASS